LQYISLNNYWLYTTASNGIERGSRLLSDSCLDSSARRNVNDLLRATVYLDDLIIFAKSVDELIEAEPSVTPKPKTFFGFPSGPMCTETRLLPCGLPELWCERLRSLWILAMAKIRYLKEFLGSVDGEIPQGVVHMWKDLQRAENTFLFWRFAQGDVMNVSTKSGPLYSLTLTRIEKFRVS
jgi:hypothetical protein